MSLLSLEKKRSLIFLNHLLNLLSNISSSFFFLLVLNTFISYHLFMTGFRSCIFLIIDWLKICSKVLQLWRGSGLPECAARGFCRMALRRLQKSLQVADLVAEVCWWWIKMRMRMMMLLECLRGALGPKLRIPLAQQDKKIVLWKVYFNICLNNPDSS